VSHMKKTMNGTSSPRWELGGKPCAGEGGERISERTRGRMLGRGTKGGLPSFSRGVLWSGCCATENQAKIKHHKKDEADTHTSTTDH